MTLLPRPVLPKPTRDQEGSQFTQKPLAPKRRNTRLACHPCRKRKVRCDGKQPVCSQCSFRHLDCAYETEWWLVDDVPKSGQAAHWREGQRSKGLVEKLRTLPYNEALDLLNSLREEGGSSAPSSLSTAMTRYQQEPTVLAVPPSISLLQSYLPTTRNGLEFELVARHPIAYPVLYPIQITDLPLDEMLKPTRINQNPLAHAEFQLSYRSQAAASSSSLHQNAYRSGSADSTDSSNSVSTPESSSSGTAIKDRLDQLIISHWTGIPISNELAARVISLYLETDYPVLPVFHADLFIEDLVHQLPQFCSRFLVSALLAWACQIYTAIDPEVGALSTLFFNEAEVATRNSPIHTLTAISAFQLLSMTAITKGRDDMAADYLQAGIQVGRSMGLFDVQPGMRNATSWLGSNHDLRLAASYTSWGTFNWSCIYGLHYQKAEIRIPPSIPLPGDVVLSPAAQDSSFIHSNPQEQTFRASCQLWTIFNDVLHSYYGRTTSSRNSIQRRPSLKYKEDIYHQILRWADNLPLSLVRTDCSDHAVVLLHVYFHAIITDLFRPESTAPREPSRLATFTSSQATADAAYWASINQLKRLLLIFRLNFKTPMYSVLWQTGLVYVANAVMQETRTSNTEWQYYLHLCMAGLQDIYASFRVFGSIAKAILGVALKHRAVTVAEARRLTNQIEQLGQYHNTVKPLGDGREMVNWVVDLDLAVTDPQAAQGSVLAERFKELILEDEEEESPP